MLKMTMDPETPTNEHPDRCELDDWLLYGPKDGRIAELVRLLAFGHGLRLRAVEDLIVRTLEVKIEELDRQGR